MDYNGDLRPLDGSLSGSLSDLQENLSGTLTVPLDGSLSGSLSDPQENLSGTLTVPSAKPAPTNVDYETQVFNHPTINSEEVVGHKTGEDYKLQNKMKRITEHDIDVIFYGG